MNTNFSSDLPIIVYFPSYAGGKFIMNCLSLSKHAVPQNRKAILHLLDRPDDYNFKLSAVLSTLPPKEKMSDWRRDWEFGDADLFQNNIYVLLKQWGKQPLPDTDEFVKKILDKKLSFFITAHGGGTGLKQLTDVWPNARVIVLTNVSKFWKIASSLKSLEDAGSVERYAGNECEEKYNQLKGIEWPSWEIFEKSGYNIDKISRDVTISDNIKCEIKQFYIWDQIKNPTFIIDVDNTYFDRLKVLDTMAQLYKWLNFDDFDANLIDCYYQQYINLHITKG